MNARWTFPVVALLALAAWGCAKTDEPASGVSEVDATPVAEETVVEVFLCGGCGQIKGTETCCAEGAAACEKCQLAAGSPGCCTIEKGTDAKLCNKCGQVAGVEGCCDPDAEKCVKCSLAKGSPGCCKMST